MISDMSGNMKLQDMKPSRLLCVLNLLEKFTEEFFHLNPISQIGIIATKNKRAEIISDLAGNPKAHVEQIRKLAGNTGSRSGTSTSNAQAANSACVGIQISVQCGWVTSCDPTELLIEVIQR